MRLDETCGTTNRTGSFLYVLVVINCHYAPFCKTDSSLLDFDQLGSDVADLVSIEASAPNIGDQLAACGFR